jgi:hypothetical protein
MAWVRTLARQTDSQEHRRPLCEGFPPFPDNA